MFGGQAVAEIAAQRLGDSVGVATLSSFLTEEDYLRARRVSGIMREETIRGIAAGRASLYARWFKPQTIIELNELALRRAREDVLKYLTFGSAARRQEVVVLEATAPQIVSLYNFGDGLPGVPVFQIENKY